MSEEKDSVPWKWIIIGVAIMALFGSWFLLPLDEWLKSFNDWVTELGPIGYLVFGAIYIIATVLLVPGAILTLAAGLAFGLWAFPVVVVAATIGAALAFLTGRYVARDAITDRYNQNDRFKAIDKAVSEDGWKIVGLLRLSPLIPFNLQNYLYGLTDIRFWHCMLATFFGIMPGTLMYVYFAAAGKAALGSDGDSGDPVLQWSLFGAGLIATVIVTVLVTRKARAKLNELGLEEKDSG